MENHERYVAAKMKELEELLAEKDKSLAEKDRTLASKDKLLVEKDTYIKALQNKLRDLESLPDKEE